MTTLTAIQKSYLLLLAGRKRLEGAENVDEWLDVAEDWDLTLHGRWRQRGPDNSGSNTLPGQGRQDADFAGHPDLRQRLMRRCMRLCRWGPCCETCRSLNPSAEFASTSDRKTVDRKTVDRKTVDRKTVLRDGLKRRDEPIPFDGVTGLTV